MKPMTLDELKQIVKANGKLDGYDYSHIHIGRGPVPWDYVRHGPAQHICNRLYPAVRVPGEARQVASGILIAEIV